jgi:NAD(P)-dependent dehydrogenase (short-subunit alcohol dehydrogenase family)
MAVLVTGAASGVGWAVTTRLMQAGTSVVMFDRDEALMRTRSAELDSSTASVAGILGSVADPSACAAAVAAAQQLDGLDGVVLCAGLVAGDGPLLQVSDQALRDIIEVNLIGAFCVIGAALPALIERSGSVVIVSSVAALRGRPGVAAYSATKGALVAMTRQLAADYGPSGVRINCVCPGGIDTPFVGPQFKGVVPANSNRRRAEADEVARVITWLVGGESAWLNGTIVPIDAAETAVQSFASEAG